MKGSEILDAVKTVVVSANKYVDSIRLEVKNEKLRVTHYGMQTDCSAIIDAIGHVDVNLAVNIASLLKILNAVDKKATLRIDGRKSAIIEQGALIAGDITYITDERDNQTGSTLRPVLDRHDPVKGAGVIQGDVLLKAMERVNYARSKKDVRFYLEGALFSFTGGLLKVIACDGHRLATATVIPKEQPAAVVGDLSLTSDYFNSLLVALKRLKKLKKLGDVHYKFDLTEGYKGFCDFFSDEFSVKGPLTDVAYPDVKRITPARQATQVAVERLALLDICKRAKKLKGAGEQRLRITNGIAGLDVFLETTENIPLLSTTVPQVAGYPYTLDFNIAFNPSYLVDLLTILEQDVVKLHIKDSRTAMAVFTQSPVGLYEDVIMPCRFKGSLKK